MVDEVGWDRIVGGTEIIKQLLRDALKGGKDTRKKLDCEECDNEPISGAKCSEMEM